MIDDLPDHTPAQHRISEKDMAMAIDIDIDAMTEVQGCRAALILRMALADLDEA